MSKYESGSQQRYERNEQLEEDIKFIRTFFQFMDQSRTLRWRSKKDNAFLTAEEVSEMKESDSEHTGQMSSLASFIVEKAKTENDLVTAGVDFSRVNLMIHIHDIEENLVGDSREKTEAYEIVEEKARKQIVEQVNKLNFGTVIESALDEYQKKQTAESQFVKALDEIQALLFMIYSRGFSQDNRDYNNLDTIVAYKYIQQFPTLERIYNVLVKIMKNQKLISTEIPDLDEVHKEFKV